MAGRPAGRPYEGHDAVLSLAVEREQFRRARHAAGRVAGEADEAGAGRAGGFGEGGGEHDVLVEGAAHAVDARYLVDGRADDGEVEPVGAADVAVEDVADMEREVEAGG